MNGFPGAWRVTGSLLNSGAVKEVVKFSKYSEEIPFAKPLPRKIFAAIGNGKCLTNVVGSSNNEYYYIGGGERKHIPKWLPVMPVIEKEEQIGVKKAKEIWGFCGEIEEKKEKENNDEGEKVERKGIELPMKRGGKVRFKIGGGVLGGGVCRRGGIGKRVLCENWIFDDQNHQNKSLRMGTK